ncbi:DUF3866 family protein [Arcanobacterium buesumense]|uniref:DUF3866 family protein n=1 Tax=Arcanobacterium buesumense TaxID=2722751 RepID=A0A6H2EL61_9ACTO|nr:DUF3866 family protein [Arcanobacterium buesumense]QJC21769.1 DUF3866 family protein [Arcanobacterium buesumense]
MMMYRHGVILTIRRSWGPACEYLVRLDDKREVRALGYVPLIGLLAPGDAVVLSASAYERGLGTGGYMLIVLAPDRLPADTPPQPGHLIKARYTPQQFMVQGVDEQESPYHELLEEADSVDGMPVIVADLHSALPAITTGIRTTLPDARIAYLMTDGGALPAWFSMATHTLKEKGHILGTITCGQAFGGELEAVTIHSGLLAARHVWKADITIIAQGPGNLGTGTRWGFSGVSCGEALNAAGTLDGVPIACVRMSNADRRDRHYGISHHTLRILRDVTKVECRVPLPELTHCPREFIDEAWFDIVKEQYAGLAQLPHLHCLDIDCTGLYDALLHCPVPLRTMGRNLEEDVMSFLSAAVAGRYSASLLSAN